jgi:hypothetical protein
VKKLLKGFLDKLFQINQNQSQSTVKPISKAEVESLVDSRIKEHAATIEKTIAQLGHSEQGVDNQEDYSLTAKQFEFALSLIEKTREYELATNQANLTVKDLNKLIAYNRYRNKGILVNLVKKGVLRRKNGFSK